MSAVSSVPAGSILLSQPLEAFQSVTVGSDQFILSVLDATTDLPLDCTGYQRTWLFAEQVVLYGSLEMICGVVAVHALKSPTSEATARLDISGTAGTSTPYPNKDPNAPGTGGGPGDSAKSLCVYVEDDGPLSPGFTVNARGGDGGAGQRGAGNCPGADGGPGGNGGQVTVAVGLPSLSWLAQLRVANAMTTATARTAALADLLSTIPATTWSTPARTAIAAAISANDVSSQQLAMTQAAQALTGLSINYSTTMAAGCDVSGGRYGVYGDGTSHGQDGEPGAPGALTTTTFGAPSELATGSFPVFFFAHPAQCSRLLDRAKLMYLVLDPVGNPTGVTDLMTLLVRLQARTKTFSDAPDTSPLAQFYTQNESQIGAVGSVTQMRSLHDQAARLISQIRHGKDLFGNNAHDVPLGSFGFYKFLLDQLTTDFAAVEESYNDYFTALAQNSAQMSSIQAARTQLAAVQQNALTQLTALQGLAQKTASIIDGFQVSLPPLKAALDKTMDDLQSEIKDTFHFDFSMLVSALSSLAVAPDSQLMMVSTAATFLYDGSTQIVNDQGLPIQTKYLVNQVTSVEATVDGLTEGFSQLDNGSLTPDDPAAGKLLAERDALDQLMGQFDGQFTGALAGLKTAFDAYIGQIVDRNKRILDYNATVLLMVRDQQLVAQARTDQANLTDEQLQTMDPALPALASFVSSVYYAARSQVMEALDLSGRAFRFWALSDEDPMVSAYGGRTPPELNHTALVAAQNTILGAYQRAVENFGTNASSFPAEPTQPGLLVQVPVAQVALLDVLDVLMVPVTVATPQTSASESPFAGMANVRVMLVRVWIDGARTADGRLQIHITHTGEEDLCDTAGKVYPFTHEPIAKLFIYDIGTKQVFEEANFGCPQTTSTGATATYAAVGPFTTWQIQVKSSENPGLDLSDVTGVRLEFHGTNLAFP